MKKQILLAGIICLIILGTVVVIKAQPTGTTVSARCGAVNNIIDVDFAYKIHPETRSTNYHAMITAGRCERQFQGTVGVTTGLETAIYQDIRAQMSNRGIALFPDPFGDLDVDGRGSFTIP